MHKAAQISVFLALSQYASLHCKITDTGLVHHACACLRPSSFRREFPGRDDRTELAWVPRSEYLLSIAF